MMKQSNQNWDKTWGTLEEDFAKWRKDITTADLQKILDAGADVNDINWDGANPLSMIVPLNRSDLIDFMLEKGCKQSTLNIALLSAVPNSTIDTINQLLKAGADPNYDQRQDKDYTNNPYSPTPILSAIRHGCSDRQRKIKLLVEYGAEATPEEIREFTKTEYDEVIDRRFTHPELYHYKKDAREWMKHHPDPTAEDFLAPMGDLKENVITRLVRAGSEALEQAFPADKWATMEAIPDLKKIFASVPRSPRFLETMQGLDNKLKMAYNTKQRQEERKRQRELMAMQQYKQQGANR